MYRRRIYPLAGPVHAYVCLAQCRNGYLTGAEWKAAGFTRFWNPSHLFLPTCPSAPRIMGNLPYTARPVCLIFYHFQHTVPEGTYPAVERRFHGGYFTYSLVLLHISIYLGFKACFQWAVLRNKCNFKHYNNFTELYSLMYKKCHIMDKTSNLQTETTEKGQNLR